MTSDFEPFVPVTSVPEKPTEEQPQDELEVDTDIPTEDELDLGEDEVQVVEEPKEVVSEEVTTTTETNTSKEDSEFEYKLTNPNVTLNIKDVKTPYEKDKDSEESPIYFASLDEIGLNRLQNDEAFLNNLDSLPDDMREALGNGMEFLHSDNVMLDTIEKENTDWNSYLQHNDKLIGAYKPKWKGKSGDNITGLKAIDMVRNSIGNGTTITIPCYASGIWLTIKAPTIMDLASNADAIAAETIQLGASTGGGVFENNQVVLYKHLMNLIDTCFYGWSLTDSGVQDGRDIRDVLLVNDLETIAWAIGCCMYPNGYPFTEPCVHDVSNCTYVGTQLLNLNKLFLVDRSKLTPWQTEFMANKTAKRSWDEIMKYRSESSWCKTSNIRISNTDMSFILKLPTVTEFIESGDRWIAQLEESVRAVISNPNNNRLNQLIFERAALSIARKFAHFVSAIIFDNGSRITRTADIEEAINEICSNEQVLKEFTEGIRKHITNTTISIVGIPRHNCPKCGKEPNVVYEEHPFVLPINALKLFAVLQTHKLRIG